MAPTPDEITQPLAARWCWQGARRADTRLARRLSRKPWVDGVYRRDAGALREDGFPFLPAVEVMPLGAQVDGTASPRERLPVIQALWLYGLQTLCGRDGMHALPPWLCSDEALRPLGGCNAQQVRRGSCQRGATQRQGERPPGPSCPAPLAKHSATLHWRGLEAGCKGSIRALAKAGVCGAKVTGMADGPELETTARDPGGGQVTRPVRLAEKRGRGPAIAVTVDGGTGRLLLEAATKMPLAVKVVPIQEPESLALRALVTPARANLGGRARRHQVVFERGFVAGPELGGLDQHGITCVVPAQATMAVTAEARAPAAAGAGRTVGRRGHTVRHGQGKTAWTARLEAAVVGITGRTTDAPEGPGEQGRAHHRRAFQATPIHAVVGRPWEGRDEGPGGTTVCLTNAPGDTPVRPCDTDEERRRTENCGIKATTQPWDPGHPPPTQDRAVRVPVRLTLWMVALATASRLPCAQEALGGAPVGWQRWRRPLLEQTRGRVMVCAEGSYGICPLADSSR